MVPITVKPQLRVAVEVEIDEGQLRLQYRPSAPEEMRSKSELAHHTLIDT